MLVYRLFFLVQIMLHLIRNLLLGGRTAGASWTSTLNLVDIDRQSLVHPLLVLVLGYGHLCLHLLRRQGTLVCFGMRLVPAHRRVFPSFIGHIWSGVTVSLTLHGRLHVNLPLRLFNLGLVGKTTHLARILALETSLLMITTSVYVTLILLLHCLCGQYHVYFLKVRGWNITLHERLLGHVSCALGLHVVMGIISHIQILFILILTNLLFKNQWFSYQK